MKNKIVGMLLMGALIFGAVTTTSSAEKDSPSKWAESAVMRATVCGLIPPAMFLEVDMTKPITREELTNFAVALYEKATGKPAVEADKNPITDTANPNVLKAINLGITSGITETTFAPQKSASKELVAELLGRALEAIIPEIDLQTSGASAFKDQKDISPSALKYVLFFNSRRIITGSNGKFMPSATTSIEQAVVYVDKIFQNLSNLAKPLYYSPYVKEGDYVQFGRYLGDPIIWRVVYINEDGNPMLFSEKILCYKPYDAAESGKAGVYGKEEIAKEKQGSSRWLNSNIREWLNCSNKKVKYSTQPPTKAAIDEGLNPYSEEAGFLSNFSLAEQQAIDEVNHKAELAPVDKEYAIAGNGTLLSYCRTPLTPAEALCSYEPWPEPVYYEMVKDKVFLPSVEEVKMIQDKGIDWKRSPTARAVKQQKYSVKENYWLRSAIDTNDRSGIVCFICYDGTVDRLSPYIPDLGICPSLYLNMNKIGKPSGDGSMKKPYLFGKIVQ